MAIGKNKKKKNMAEDILGSKELPYVTNERAMENSNIVSVRDLSATTKSKRKNVIKYILFTFFAIIAISLVSSLTANSRINAIKEDMHTLSTPAFKSKYDSLGKSIIESYFSGGKAPINLLSTAQWLKDTGQDSETSNSDEIQSVDVDVESVALIDAYQTTANLPELEEDMKSIMTNPVIEVLTYTGTVNGEQYKIGVTLLIPDNNNPLQLPYLLYAPNLSPIDDLNIVEIEAGRPPLETNGAYTEFDLPEPALNVISDWAVAYAQNDEDSIKRLTGDPKPENIYKGIGGFTLRGTPVIEWSYAFAPDGEDQDIAVARVTFNMQKEVSSDNKESENLSGRESENLFIVEQTFDVMLHNFTQGTPNIVAWTQPGNWANLRSELNATVRKQEETDTPSPTPTDTLTEETTEDENTANIPSLTRSTTPRNNSEETTQRTKSQSNSTRTSSSKNSNNSNRENSSDTTPRRTTTSSRD